MNRFDVARVNDAAGTWSAPERAGPLVSAAPQDVAGVEPLLTAVVVVGAIVTLLLIWSTLRVPGRVGRAVVSDLACPVLRRAIVAAFQLDATDTKPIEVNWCTAFRPTGMVRCKKRCLRQERAGATFPETKPDTPRRRP